jgi:hypothetical protein
MEVTPNPSCPVPEEGDHVVVMLGNQKKYYAKVLAYDKEDKEVHLNYFKKTVGDLYTPTSEKSWEDVKVICEVIPFPVLVPNKSTRTKPKYKFS